MPTAEHQLEPAHQELLLFPDQPATETVPSGGDLSGLQMEVASRDVIVTTQKTIDLVFHNQVFKLQRTRQTPTCSGAGRRSLRHNGIAEGHHETPDHSSPIQGH